MFVANDNRHVPDDANRKYTLETARKSRTTRKKLLAIATGGNEAKGSVSRASGQSNVADRRRKSDSLKPGSRLVREWNGVVHRVDVAEGGFIWNGQTLKSLSAVARAITGARWSGPRFFGL